MPTPDQIRDARSRSGLSQSRAAALIHSTRRTWQDWEAGIATMHEGLWELFILRTAAWVVTDGTEIYGYGSAVDSAQIDAIRHSAESWDDVRAILGLSEGLSVLPATLPLLDALKRGTRPVWRCVNGIACVA